MIRSFFKTRTVLIQSPLPSYTRTGFVYPSVRNRRNRPRLDIDSYDDPGLLCLHHHITAKMQKTQKGNHNNYEKRSEQRKKMRGLPKDSTDVRVSKTLSWLLRHGAKQEGLAMRPDGYVEVTDLLNNNRLRDLTLLKLQDIVKADLKNRYSLICESDIWLIRANQGHSMKTITLELDPILSADQVPMAVHGTTIKAWQSISTQGLSRMTRNHIHLAQGIAGQNIISGVRNSSQILIYIDLPSALSAGLKFYLSANGVVLSEGDENGFIKPEFFRRVENSKREALSGWEGRDGDMWKVLGEGMPKVEVPKVEVEEKVEVEVENTDTNTAGLEEKLGKVEL